MSLFVLLKYISGREISLLLRIGAFIIVFIIISINKKKNIAEDKESIDKIDINELEILLQKLLENKLHFDFVGIKTNKNNCLYFVNNNGKIALDYEVLEKEQLPFLKLLKSYAKNNNLKLNLYTYGNKAKFGEKKSAPVYQIASNLSIEEAKDLAKEIYIMVFECSDSVFEVLP